MLADENGFSLIELLIALSLLSIVMLAGFSFFGVLEVSYLRSASQNQKIETARAQADSFFAGFNGTQNFDPSSIDTSALSVHRLWQNPSWYDSSGAFYCQVTSANASSFTIETSCFTQFGISLEDMSETLTTTELPSVVLIGAQEACIIRSLESATPLLTRLHVANSACLLNEQARTIANASGVILPRFIITTQEGIASMYFTPFAIAN